MADLDMIPIVPPDLGAVLASPVAYAEWAIAFPGPAPAPRVRRPGRVRRRVAAGVAVVAAAALAVAGCGAVHHAPAAGTPWLPPLAARELQAVHADLGPVHHVRPAVRVHRAVRVRQAPAPAPVMPATAPAPAPAPRPTWDGRGTYDSGIQPLCPAADRGRHAVAGSGAHKFAVVCVANGPVFGWDAVTGGART